MYKLCDFIRIQLPFPHIIVTYPNKNEEGCRSHNEHGKIDKRVIHDEPKSSIAFHVFVDENSGKGSDWLRQLESTHVPLMSDIHVEDHHVLVWGSVAQLSMSCQEACYIVIKFQTDVQRTFLEKQLHKSRAESINMIQRCTIGKGGLCEINAKRYGPQSR